MPETPTRAWSGRRVKSGWVVSQGVIRFFFHFQKLFFGNDPEMTWKRLFFRFQKRFFMIFQMISVFKSDPFRFATRF